MAKNQKVTKTDEPIALDVQLSKGEAFIEKNWKVLCAALAVIVVIMVGTYIYKNWMANRELNAQKAIASAQMSFAQGQYEQALNGDGNTTGFIKIISEYSGTETANLAKLYAGLACANIDKVDEAIKYLEDFSAKNDQMISPAALGALGNCYIQKGEIDKGIAALVKAADKADNDAISPVLLLQAAEALESVGKSEEAVNLYNKIKTKYFRSAISQDIDKYIEHATK